MEMKCVVVTPERTALEQSASLISVPLYDGAYGIALNHTPVVGRLGAGELRLKSADKTDVYYVSGGFVEVMDNVVSLLTSRAIPIAEITLQRAEMALVEAKAKPHSTPEETALRDAAINEARAMLRIAKKISFLLKFCRKSEKKRSVLLFFVYGRCVFRKRGR